MQTVIEPEHLVVNSWIVVIILAVHLVREQHVMQQELKL